MVVPRTRAEIYHSRINQRVRDARYIWDIKVPTDWKFVVWISNQIKWIEIITRGGKSNWTRRFLVSLLEERNFAVSSWWFVQVVSFELYSKNTRFFSEHVFIYIVSFNSLFILTGLLAITVFD